jgi:hypothetical protein
VPPPSRMSQYYLASCSSGECGVVDIRTTAYVTCSSDSDCFLRVGLGCCDACPHGDWVALSSTGFLDADCTDLPCPACDPPPPKLDARCVMQRCTLVYPPVAGG